MPNLQLIRPNKDQQSPKPDQSIAVSIPNSVRMSLKVEQVPTLSRPKIEQQSPKPDENLKSWPMPNLKPDPTVKDQTPIEKVFDCRVLQKKRIVTKNYAERKKLNPTFSVFGAGLGTGNDSLRMNATITMVQRDNIWHPFYEISSYDYYLNNSFGYLSAKK